MNIANDSELPKYKTDHRARNESFAEYYTPATVKLVADKYDWELRHFGYESPRELQPKMSQSQLPDPIYASASFVEYDLVWQAVLNP